MSKALLSAVLIAAVAGVGAGGASERHSARATWAITDLGTLPGGYRSAAIAINSRGQIVGTSNAGKSSQHVFLWLAGKMTDLGALRRHGSVTGINNRGQVVWDGYLQSVMWDKGRVTKLGFAAAALNNAGQVVGRKRAADGRFRAVLWSGGRLRTLSDSPSVANAVNNRGVAVGVSGGHAVLWRNGRMVDLGTLGGDFSEGTAINDRGQIAGVSRTRTGADHAFLWQSGKMLDLGVAHWDVLAVDERGQVLVETGSGAWVLWSNGRTRNLGTLGGDCTEPKDLGDEGEVVGASCLAPVKKGFRGKEHAFVWNEGTMTDLGRSGGGPNASRAYGINDRHEIVGATETGETVRAGTPDQAAVEHAVLWTRGPA